MRLVTLGLAHVRHLEMSPHLQSLEDNEKVSVKEEFVGRCLQYHCCHKEGWPSVQWCFAGLLGMWG